MKIIVIFKILNTDKMNIILPGRDRKVHIGNLDDHDISVKSVGHYLRSKSHKANFSPHSTEKDSFLEVDNSITKIKRGDVIKKLPQLKHSRSNIDIVNELGSSSNRMYSIIQTRKLLGKRELVDSSSFVFNEAIKTKQDWKFNLNHPTFNSNRLNPNVRDIDTKIEKSKICT
jgi:hypothetical protein